MEFNLENLQINDLHHFNIIENGTVECVNNICQQKLNFDFVGNNNYYYKKFNEIQHDEANEISHILSLKKSFDDKMIIVIECNSLNANAQNILLKVFEEVTHNKYIFLLIPKVNNLLPTLLSRAEIFVNKNDSKVIDNFHYENLRKMTLKERLNFVDKIIEKYKKEEITKSSIEFSLTILIKEALVAIKKTPEIKQSTIKSLSQSLKLMNHIQDNGAHIKSILEFVFINI